MRLHRRNGQSTVEVILVMSAVLLAIAWATMALPNAIKDHYEQNRDVISGPM